jgi:transmembrane sensor
MKITQHEWPRLLEKYRRGELSESERHLLDQHRQRSAEKEEQYKHVTDRRWLINTLHGMYQFDQEAGWAKVLQQAGAASAPVIALPRRRTWLWKTALVALHAGAAYLILQLFFSLSMPSKTIIIADGTHTGAVTPPNNAELIWLNQQRFALASWDKDTLLSTPDYLVIKEDSSTLRVHALGQPGASAAPMVALNLPANSFYKIKLPDGSLAVMSPSSQIRFPARFSSKERRIEIDGEVYLDVVENKRWPFTVMYNHRQLQVLGTRFIVRSYPGQPVSVWLLKGKVLINGRTLRPNEELISRLNQDDIIIKRDSTRGFDEMTALQANQFNLKKELRSILADVSLCYQVSVVYPDNVRNPILLGVLNRQQSLDSLVKTLGEMAEISIKLKNHQIIVAD